MKTGLIKPGGVNFQPGWRKLSARKDNSPVFEGQIFKAEK
jgi:hypothetical protein